MCCQTCNPIFSYLNTGEINLKVSDLSPWITNAESINKS